MLLSIRYRLLWLLALGFLLGYIFLLNAPVNARPGAGAPTDHQAYHPSGGCTPVWTVVPSPYTGTGSDELRDVAMRTTTDGWAVGTRYNSSSSLYQTLIMHWDGMGWTIVPSPNVGTGNNYLSGVAARSPSDAWAVGSYSSGGYSQTLTMHWDGTSWTIVSSPNPGVNNSLSDVALVGTNGAWAVGSASSSSLALYWNGSAWSRMTSHGSGFSGVTVVSANDVWAVGYSSGIPYTTLIEHWNGSTWTTLPTPNPGSYTNSLSAVAAAGPNDIWAVGVWSNSNYYLDRNSLALHWNGTAWTQVLTPNVAGQPNYLEDIVAVAGNDVWAVGYAGYSSGARTLAQHWDGTQWSIATSANGGSNDNYLYGVAALAGNDLWAVGQYRENVTYIYRSLVERYGGPCPTLTPTPTPTRTPTITPTPGGEGWTMYGHDSLHTSRSRVSGPTSANLAWVLANPEIVGGVVVGSNGMLYGSSYSFPIDYLYALNPDGTVRWQWAASTWYARNINLPAVTAGAIYQVSDASDTRLYAIDPATGTTLWSYPIERPSYSKPTIGPDGTIYIASQLGVGSDGGYLYAINPNGTLHWMWNSGVQYCGIESTVAVGPNGDIYLQHNCRGLVALHSDGQLYWTLGGASLGQAFNSPSVGPDGTIYLGSSDHNFYAINPNGTYRWQVPVQNWMYSEAAAISADGSTIYRGDNGGIFYAFDRQGFLRWSFNTGNNAPLSTPSLAANGIIYFTEIATTGSGPRGYLYALRGADGVLLWQHEIGFSGDQPAIGPDGTVYATGENPTFTVKLYAFNCLGGACPNPTPTGTPSRTPTGTPSRTPTQTPSHTPTGTPTGTPSRTPTQTPSHTPTGTPTGTRTATQTPTPPPAATQTETFTPTPPPSRTATLPPTPTPGGSTVTPIPTVMPSPTQPPPPPATPTLPVLSATPARATATPPGGLPTPTATLCPLQFSDVPSSNTFYPFIRCLACRQIVSGYADGTFRWGNNVTRGQLSKIISAAADQTNQIPSTQQTFEDVPNSNAFWLFIERLSGGGAISGYTCGGPGEPCVPPGNRPYFRWGGNATRGQIAKITAVTAGWNGPIPTTQQTFSDVPPTNAFWTSIEELANRQIINGYLCGGLGEPCDPPARPYFRWGANATRGQMSKIAAQTFYPDCQTPARGSTTAQHKWSRP